MHQYLQIYWGNFSLFLQVSSNKFNIHVYLRVPGFWWTHKQLILTKELYMEYRLLSVMLSQLLSSEQISSLITWNELGLINVYSRSSLLSKPSPPLPNLYPSTFFSFLHFSIFSLPLFSALPLAIPSSSRSFPASFLPSSPPLSQSFDAQDKLKCLKPNSVSSVIFFNRMNSYSAKGHYIQGARPTAINHILFLIAHYIIHIDFNPVASAENSRICCNVSSPW